MMKKNIIQRVSEVSELRNKAVEQLILCLNPRKGKKVTFDLNVTTYTYEHEDFADDFVISSYPFHNAGESDNEADEKDLDDEVEDMNTRSLVQDLGDLDDEDEDVIFHQVWTESILDAPMDSSSPSPPAIRQQVESPLVKIRSNARDRGNSVRNPVENISQWKAAKSKRVASPLDNSANFKAPRLLFSSNQEIAVAAVPSNKSSKSSLNGSGFKIITKSRYMSDSVRKPVENISQWKAAKLKRVASPLDNSANFKAPRLLFSSKSNQEITVALPSNKSKSSFNGSEFKMITKSRYMSDSVRKPIENISQWKAAKSKGTTSLSKPQKANSVSKKPYDMAQDKRVNWYSTPFEMRLDRALKSQ